MRYYFAVGGAGYLLYSGRQVIWETATLAQMRRYLKDHNLRDIEYRRPSIHVFR